MFSTIFSTWLDAIRLKTLPLAVACILCGSSIAAKTVRFSLTIALLTLITALLLQILSNLANDYGDAVKGTDNDARIGPKRAIQLGLVTPYTMKKAMILNLVLIIIFGLILLITALHKVSDILSFMVLGTLAIIAALYYTIGSKPYGYHGLGDLSVLVFFGLIGVAGTYYLQTGTLNIFIFLPATACGLLAVAVLNINNLRDIDNDRACNKRTLVVRMGSHRSRTYHQVLLASAYACFTLFSILEHIPVSKWLFILTIPLTIKHSKVVLSSSEGASLRPMMANMVKVALLTNVLFAVGILL
ncbi:1,4-dihydroxy-2-naphthoate polyprenyltransferase [Candidatus Enterovibrio escicola]|uniref:1,4-dihydroxy-2-naphthoate polyprenyltransferase n=1 Tax=Candidatus Enterovibrio escicola TaxID=1927127 RepID=UPI001237E440|nr:1,4-dihydroxy-2-naphthoate polyprenyltransferase [Candidatus Enterovibrio escacola]